MRKENIVYFVADQMRSDTLSHLGNPASVTPNLDSLLEEGISFENAYCQNPVCVPSRCSFLTGLYPHTTGHRTIHYLQNEGEPNILREMKNNGYEVIWIGRNDVIPADRLKTEFCDEFYDGVNVENMRDKVDHELQKKMHKGMSMPKISMSDDRYYSFYIGELDKELASTSYDWNCVNSALDYIDRKKISDNGKPFFLYVTLQFPHPPYGCEEPWFSMINRNNLETRRPNVDELEKKPSMLHGIFEKQNLKGWTDDRWNELRATYLAQVARFDHQYGLIRDKLKETGFYDSTNIFVFSDHGDYTGDYGIVEKVQNCFEDPISNVPLLVKPSKSFKISPRISSSLVELVDLSATIADITDIKLSYTQFGKSLVHLFDKEHEHKDAVFCEGGRIHGEVQAMEVGHGPESLYYPRLATQASEGPEHTKAIMMRMGNFKYIRRLYEFDEFYDLSKDPNELYNQIDNPEYEPEIAKMKIRLLNHYMETTDFVPNRKDKR